MEGGRRGTNLSAKVPSLLGHPVDGSVQSITLVLLASLEEREREKVRGVMTIYTDEDRAKERQRGG